MSFVRNNPTRAQKNEIIRRIQDAAQIYKNELVGKTFLVLYEGRSAEIIFKSDNFLHLCGVDTRITPKDFLKKALRRELRAYEIGFSDNIHPYRYAEIKTRYLEDALHLFQRECLMITDISTVTRNYKLGTTDLEVVFCFDEQLDSVGKPISNILNPFSLRIEEISNNNFQDIYEVDYILSKETTVSSYSETVYGDIKNLRDYLSKHNISDYEIAIPGMQEESSSDN